MIPSSDPTGATPVRVSQPQTKRNFNRGARFPSLPLARPDWWLIQVMSQTQKRPTAHTNKVLALAEMAGAFSCLMGNRKQDDFFPSVVVYECLTPCSGHYSWPVETHGLILHPCCNNKPVSSRLRMDREFRRHRVMKLHPPCWGHLSRNENEIL